MAALASVFNNEFYLTVMYFYDRHFDKVIQISIELYEIMIPKVSMIPHDPIIDELRKVREEYASELIYDLDAIYRSLKEKQRQSGKKIYSFEVPKRGISSSEQGSVK